MTPRRTGKHAYMVADTYRQMYLDRELQIILSTPVSGAMEGIVIKHEAGARDEVLTWIREQPDVDAEIKPLPKQMIAVRIDQRNLPRLLSHDSIRAAAVDDGAATLLLQNRDELLNAAATARAVADRATYSPDV